jgi:DNA-binding transcriptional regulator YiaG
MAEIRRFAVKTFDSSYSANGPSRDSHPLERDPLNHAIGRHLRRCRERRGLTQTVLARNLGFTYQQLQKYELGINRISLPTVLRLLKVLEITPIQFMESLSDDLGNLVERPGTLALSPTAFR